MNACWGKLASEILMQNWDAALEDLNKVKEVIDQNVSKCHWLLHNIRLR
jgi:translation initiation factor 3 subunit E